MATVMFFLAGALFGTLNATVFRVAPEPRIDLIVVAIACAVAALGVWVIGERLSTFLAGALMICVLVVVMPSILLAPDAVRAINMGLLFTPFFVFLVWFLPMWFARLLGYTWMGIYVVLMLARFGDAAVAPALMTLAVTGLLLGELIGRFKARLEHTSITDALCDVWNKRGFERLLGKAVTSSQRSGQPLALLYLDLDHFKEVNDARGHTEGDRVLREFSRAVQERTRPQDVFARFGGDEFAMLLLDADAAHARQIGERLQNEIREPGWSFGVSEWQPGENSEQFISRADLLMLRTKRGRSADAA